MPIRTLVFSLTLLLSSFLLFLVQPMIGRMVLPSLGGTPAVWNGCMLFFQAVLLAGYAWAHYGPSRLGMRNHLLVHLFLLGGVCCCLPMRMLSSWSAPVDSNPMGWLLGQLTLCVGLPFFVISSSAPLLQRWFNASRQPGESGEPWFLYAVSNVGSLAALACYPLVLEPTLGLTDQGWLWTFGFMGLALMFLGCAWLTLTRTGLKRGQTLSGQSENIGKTVCPPKGQTPFETKPGATAAKPLPWNSRWTYILLAAIPSSLMLGVTTIVSTEVGSFPLMWSIPLALYLLTFVIVFSRFVIIPHHWLVRFLPLILLLMPLVSIIDLGNNPTTLISLHFTTFFIVAMVCHGELARLKPDASQLTEFYLMMSIGGVVGGAFNSLLAPVLFNSILEYPLVLAAACFVLPQWQQLKSVRTKFTDINPTIDQKKVLLDRKGSETASQWINNLRSVGTGPLVLLVLLLAAGLFRDLLVGLPFAVMIVLLFGIPAFICFTFSGSPKKFALGYAVIALVCPLLLKKHDVVASYRGFFGVNEITVAGDHEYHVLINGRTSHGIQRTSERHDPQPLSYYHRQGPIGDVFRLHGDQKSQIGVVGLGVGTIAAYGQPGQRIDFYEIDPIVCQIANDQRYFTYLSTTRGEVQIIKGDARVQLEARRQSRVRERDNISNVSYRHGESTSPRADNGKYGLLVLDAFGSDAVPIHLLTAEAMQLYFDMLDEDGLLVVHISSKFMDFVPVAAGFIEHLGYHGAIRLDLPTSDEINSTGRSASKYLILSRTSSLIQPFLEAETGWQPIDRTRQLLWTDERANILDVLRW